MVCIDRCMKGYTMAKIRWNFTLSKKARKLLEKLAELEQMTSSEYLEFRIRQEADAKNVKFEETAVA